MTLFQGGVPTDVDVAEIRKAWPSIKPGDEIGYDDVSAVIKVPVEAHRFRTVTTRWRRMHERITSEIIACDPTRRAFVVLAPSGRVGMVEAKDKSLAKQNRRNFGRAAATKRDDLTAAELAALDYVTTRSGAVLLALKSNARKQLTEPTLALAKED